MLKAPKPGQFVYEYSREEAADLVHNHPDQAIELILSYAPLINTLMKQVAEHSKQIEQLQQQIGKNSSNSSKPPSSDGYSKPSPKSLRGKSGKNTGGQKGHKGNTLSKVAVPDEVILHDVSVCTCGASLADAKIVKTESRQVYDIPEPRIHVVEHQVVTKLCACGKLCCSTFPSTVTAPTQYGPRILSLGVYLNQYQFLPLARTCQTVNDLFSCSVSQATVLKAVQEFSDKTMNIREAITTDLLDSHCIHSDETGVRVNGKLHWIHSASSTTSTSYHVDKRRGKEAMTAADILPHFTGTVIHDGWKAYTHFDCTHGLCNVHHLRELLYITEFFKQSWASELSELLLEIKQAVDQRKAHGFSSLEDSMKEQFLARYDTILAKGYADNPWVPEVRREKRGRKKKPKPVNLLDRLSIQKDSVLLFMKDFEVPFSNNLAERDIRMVKVQQKISGCFRTLEMAKDFCNIRGFLSTMGKRGISAWEAINSIFQESLDPVKST